MSQARGDEALRVHWFPERLVCEKLKPAKGEKGKYLTMLVEFPQTRSPIRTLERHREAQRGARRVYGANAAGQSSAIKVLVAKQ